MNNIFIKTISLAVFIVIFNASCTSQVNPPVEETAQVIVDADGYSLVWQDLFDGTTLNSVNWTPEVNGNGGGNSELQYYRSENISVGTEPVSGENCLIITAKKESYSGKTCTSGRLTTSNKMSFKHGKIVARIKLPHTANGLWPAFWAMGQDYSSVGWPKCGEIDILEMGNSKGISNGTQEKYFNSWFHWGESWNGGSYPNWGKDYTHTTGIQDDFYLFTLIWDDTSLKTYFGTDDDPLKVNIVTMAIDGDDVAGNAAHYFHKEFFVIFNLAIGGNFTQIWNINSITALNEANNYEAKMYVDYVKVYQKGTSDEEYTGPAITPNAINVLKASRQYEIYPNPVVNNITVVGDDSPSCISVLSLSGTELLRVVDSKQINTENLSSGNYLLKITNSKGVIETHKIVKK
ncbi:MAG: T9SS type A sorting domain-containing protein [Paludibacter sp.]|nr:T9SS type A sorting domain-containing protein [Paludibacter sp.]